MFDQNRADYVCDFLELLAFGSGNFEGQPFRLQQWQRDPLREFYGTIDVDPDTGEVCRHYQYLYEEIPKKNGKTEVAAGLGLYHLVGDGEKNPQVYICAADKENASICYNAMCSMIDSRPWLGMRVKQVPSKKEIHLRNGSGFIKVLSSEAYSKHGYNKIKVDLLKREILPKIDAVQNDANSRGVEISLVANGVEWKVPSGKTAAVAFSKPDGTRGLYDKLPNGTAAVTISGSNVTAIFAPEMLTVHGVVQVAVILMDENLNQLATFPFVVNVAPNPAVGCAISQNYYKLQSLGDANRAFEDLSRQVAAMLDDGRVSAETTWSSEKIQEEISKSLYTPRNLDDAQKQIARSNIDAATIDDSDVGLNGWSSKNTVDKLCPPFKKSGSVVTCEPVEGYPLEVSSRFEQKNLLYCTSSFSGNNEGIAYTRNIGVSSMVLNGTATEETSVGIAADLLLKAGTYTISAYGLNTIDSFHDRVYVECSAITGPFPYAMAGKPMTFTLNFDARVFVAFVAAEGSTYNNKEIYFQIEKGEVATPYEPHKGFTQATLTRRGKNLLQSTTKMTDTYNGITFERRIGDSSISLNGTALNDTSIGLTSDLPLKAGTYTLSVHGVNTVTSNSDRVYVNFPEMVGGYPYAMAGKPRTFTIDTDTRISANLVIAKGSVYNNATVFVQIEEGTSATPYEPYGESKTYSVEFGRSVFSGIYNWSTGLLTDHSGNIYEYPAQSIFALPGTNILQGSTACIDVVGRANPVATINNILTRMAALEAAVINNT